jgi:hypothetical protein
MYVSAGNKMSLEQVAPSWYVAELVIEITVFGASRNVVHRNLLLILAADADQAYQKAARLGLGCEISYDNPQGQRVDHRFRGIAKLDGIVDGTLEDGSELTFVEDIGVSERQIEEWICTKKDLGAFAHPDPSRKFDPDYRSGEVMQQIAELLRGPKP